MVDGGNGRTRTGELEHSTRTWIDDAAPLPEGCRNNSLTSLAGWLRWQGADRYQIEAELLDANARRCVPPLAAPEVRAIAKSIARYPAGAARDAVTREQFDAAQTELAELAGDVLAVRWGGRSGTTDRDVLLALLKVGYATGRTAVRASVRRAAELAGVTRDTAYGALRRLQRAGWLTLVAHCRTCRTHYDTPTLDTKCPTCTTTPARHAVVPPEPFEPTRGATWRLNLQDSAIRQTRDSRSRREGDAGRRLLSYLCRSGAKSDGGRNGYGIGRGAERLLDAMSSESRRIVDLVALVNGTTRRTVERQLTRLAAVGLVVRDGSGWRRTDLDLDAVAGGLHNRAGLAALGATERQQEQHDREREGFEEQRVRWAHDRAAQRANRLAEAAKRATATVAEAVKRTAPKSTAAFAPGATIADRDGSTVDPKHGVLARGRGGATEAEFIAGLQARLLQKRAEAQRMNA